jgi:hypothetical protein
MERNFMTALGFDQTRGTIGAGRLGDVTGPDLSGKEAKPLRKCAYVIVGDDGNIVGRCGTILREGNRGCFCSLHTKMKVRGAKYIEREDAKKRNRAAREHLHLVRDRNT